MAEKIFYLTKEKFEELKKEYQVLLVAEADKTKGEVPKIFESEDINTEYIDFQEGLNSLRSRMEELQNIFKNYQIIKRPNRDQKKFVNVGATVSVLTEGKKNDFTVVGTLDTDPTLGRISNESPIGKALLNHKVGDEVIVFLPSKSVYKILKIKYRIS